jgi:hypothetical protein
MRLSSIFPVLAIVALVGCSNPPKVSVQNLSTMTVVNLRLSGNGFETTLPSLAAGETWRPIVHPVGESPARLEFDSGGKHFDSGYQSYFEPSGGYIVKVEINSDLAISITSNL